MRDTDQQMRFYEELGYGLHAMAQPLTVLRGALGALALRGDIVAEPGRYLEMSNQQVERLCGFMFGLQCLVDAYQFEPACVKVNLWELAESLLENGGSDWRDSGTRIMTTKTDGHVHVTGDPARTEQAIRAALSAAIGLARQGDAVHFGIVLGDGFADLTVENRNSRGRCLSSSDRLQLLLAEANIRSQQGLYECVENPFRISMKLPLHDEQEMNIEAASDCASLEEVGQMP